jgi:uncharacterized membrane-anchored protein
MKFIGCLLMLVSLSTISHSESITWGLVAMIIVGAVMVFPNLLQYFFEGMSSERK